MHRLRDFSRLIEQATTQQKLELYEAIAEYSDLKRKIDKLAKLHRVKPLIEEVRI
jgi:hypothetical protein